MSLKQLFCGHVWQNIDEKPLRKEREAYIPAFSHNPTTYADFEYVAVYQKCVKCQKERTIEKRFIIW